MSTRRIGDLEKGTSSRAPDPMEILSRAHVTGQLPDSLLAQLGTELHYRLVFPTDTGPLAVYGRAVEDPWARGPKMHEAALEVLRKLFVAVLEVVK